MLPANLKDQTFLDGGEQEEVAVWEDGGSKVFRTGQKNRETTPHLVRNINMRKWNLSLLTWRPCSVMQSKAEAKVFVRRWPCH